MALVSEHSHLAKAKLSSSAPISMTGDNWGIRSCMKACLLAGVVLWGNSVLWAHLRSSPRAECELPPAKRVVEVFNSKSLSSALLEALPGDRIVMASGKYEGEFAFKKSGSEELPIYLQSEELLSAGFRGELRIEGEYLALWGLRFANARLEISGDNVSVSRCLFDQFEKEKAIQLNVTGKDVTIEYCEFRESKGRGIAARPYEGMRRLMVRRCYFHDFVGIEGESVHEPIQLGLGAKDRKIEASCVIEYNLFERVNVDAEAVSVKSSGNILRFNTLIDSRIAKFSNRSGDGNLFAGNWVERSGGFGVMCADSEFVGNVVLESTYGFRIFSGICSPRDPADNKKYPACWDTRFIGNRSDKTHVGAQFTGVDMPVSVQGLVFEAHTGPITLENEIGTVQRVATDQDVPVAFRIGSGEVGPLAKLGAALE